MSNFSNVLSAFFRISDSPTPDKCCQREVCFINFLNVFKGLPITVVADNVSPKTLAFVSQPGVKVVQTNLGNSGSFLASLELAAKAETMFAYFCEDDYIHRPEAAQLVVEGLRWSNYITLYDHPDKYIKERGYGEMGRCLKSETWHWRQTISTTCTFGANLGLLRQDMDVIRKHATGTTPADHAMWCELAQKQRSLTVAIPGAAFNTHRACEHSGFDWGQIWAFQQMKQIADAINRSNVFQPPPDNLTFAPVNISSPPGLPNLAAMGRTTQQANIPPVAAKASPGPSQSISEAKRPALAIPDPLGWHNESLKKKKFEVQEGNFGAFVPLDKPKE